MLSILSLVSLVACGGSERTSAPAAPAAPPAIPRHTGLFKPLPRVAEPATEADRAMVALGMALYHDTRLSKNQDLSCNSCHDLSNAGVDNQPTSPGHRGTRGRRNTPTTYNAFLHTAQLWDGRAADVEAQAMATVIHPLEMAMKDGDAVNTVLTSIPGYAPMFTAAFPADPVPVSFKNAARALGAFERTLVTPSAFDRYLEGDVHALTAQQVAGMDLFVAANCTMCHNGPGVGGGMYMKLGFARPYGTTDPGRFEVTGNEADTHVFKVPSLRNVARTGPYFHDGSVATLGEAVTKMGAHQLDRDLTPAEVASIVTFLNALTGQPPAVATAIPELPPSGPTTPKPDPT
jgi:cytochrome c peroxidase